MDLSIIIVNYNVLPFLRQCIQSVVDACQELQYEIIIVDNDSSDGSQSYLNEIQNSNIRILLNDENIGFGRAMNQGIEKAQGEYYLFLNPDTVITNESVLRSLQKLKMDGDCGGVGVRMVDGQGNFLKESKRGFPTVWSSIFKMTGLSALFPKSKIISHYHQGHLDSNTNHKVDILTGAFLMTRKEQIKELGGFDEQYFMYGEDIDLSHSITNLGFYNYYIGDTSIIHFKGESTQKDSLISTYHFYNSMLLFAKKYNSTNFIYIAILSTALVFIGTFRWIQLNLLSFLGPLMRLIFYFLVFWIVSKIWGAFNFDDLNYFDYGKHQILILSYSMILSIGYALTSQKLARLKNLIWATITILTLYSLLPLSFRSSRAVIVLGSGLIFIMEVSRLIVQHWRSYRSVTFWNERRGAVLLGKFDPCLSALGKLKHQRFHDYHGIICDEIHEESECITNFAHLENYLSIHDVDTLTMHMESMSMDRIMEIISRYGPKYQYLLFSSSSNAIIDSPDSKTQGNVSIVEISWAIVQPINRTTKRALDIITSFLFILLSPILIWFVQNKSGWISNIFQSLRGKTTWVGYSKDDHDLDKLPRLRPSVLSLNHEKGQGHFENVTYARDYNLFMDLKLIINGIANLGNKVELNAKY